MVQTTLPPRAPSLAARDVGRATGSWWFVGAVALLAVALRTPGIDAPPGADEAGFLEVARQWAPGGGSLYGHYWVDRPPLLITLYAAADGLVALRILGSLAVLVTVVASAAAAARLAGPRAACWTSVVAGGLLVSPQLDSSEVNGELLAAPFVAVGVLAVVAATTAVRRRDAFLLAAGGGAAGLAALMVKQNVADVLVFGAVLLVLGARWLPVPGLRWRPVALGGLAGGVVFLAVLAGWTAVHGTSVVDVYDALYPFRLSAARVVAAGDSQYASARAGHLALAWLTSGAALLTVTLVVASRRRPTVDAAVVALAATVAYAMASIALGGGYWLHYLVELVVPLAVWTGVLVGRGAWLPRPAALVVAVAGVVAAAGFAVRPHGSVGADVGSAIGAVDRPGDTLTTLYGEPQVNFAARLPSPYPQLWSLPVKTLDAHLEALDSVLRSPAAPTWLVVTHAIPSWGLDTLPTQRLVERRYHEVAVIEGQTVYLRDDVRRPTPVAPSSSAPDTP